MPASPGLAGETELHDAQRETSRHPGGPIVFFDGVCGLCDRTVDFLLRVDRRGKLRFAPLQGDTARERLGIRGDEPLRSLVLADADGVWSHSTAVARTLQHVGRSWGLLGTLLRWIPRPLRDWGYGIIARNRYRWFGKSEACRMPGPGERERFLP